MDGQIYCWKTRALFGDIDYFGVVYYLKYFDWCTQAREHFILDHNPEELSQVYPSVIEVTHKFHHAARLNDEISIDIHFQEVKKTSVWMNFHLHRSAEGRKQRIGVHRQKILFLTRDGKITRMSPALYATLQRYELPAAADAAPVNGVVAARGRRPLLPVAPVAEPF